MRFHPGRFRGFLLLSAALIAAVVVTAGMVVGTFFERHVMAQEEAQAAEIVRNQAHQHLIPGNFDLAEGSALEHQKNFEEFLQGLPGVFRLKAFHPTGRIVWSNEPRLIGMRFPDDTYVQAALSGRVTTVLEKPSRAEHVFERNHRYVAEVYVPVGFPGSAGVIGVVEP